MSLSTVPTERALAEASDWFARLKKRDVPAADMEEFRVWRKAPGHKEAYDLVDAFWKRGEALQGDADIQAAMAQTLERTSDHPLPRQRRHRLGLGLAFAGVLLACATTYGVLAQRTYTTEVGERRTVRLADGSTLTLDTDSAASVRFTHARRDIQLRKGQALFDVAHDPARPFVVKAGDTSVTALGTRFDVRRDAVGAVVTLVRGAVEVREAAGSTERVWRLAPGQRVVTALPAARPAAADVASATSWTSGRLVFHDVPLRAAVTEFNRYERRRIKLDPGPWDQDRISGAFDVGDTRTFVQSVAELHDLTVSIPEKGEIRLSRAGDGDAVP